MAMDSNTPNISQSFTLHFSLFKVFASANFGLKFKTMIGCREIIENFSLVLGGNELQEPQVSSLGHL